MSSRWPSSLLNSTNQQLTERIEQFSVELESKRNTVAELREVVKLLKKDQQQAQRQEKAAAEALASEREALEKDEGELKQLTGEVEGSARRLHNLSEKQARLDSAVASLEVSMEHKRRKLEEEQKLSAMLEEKVKEIVFEHLARQRVGEELSAAQRELSSAVWAKLERLNEQVSSATQRLADARVEHHRILRELDAVRLNLQEAVKEQYDSVRALELIHAQSSQLDAQVVTNSASIETLKQTAHERKMTRDRMRVALECCLTDNKQRALARDLDRSRYDQQLREFRQLVDGIREEEAHLAGCTSRQHAEEHNLQQQRRELDRIIHLREEKMSLLALEKARHDALVEVHAQLEMQINAGAPSLAAIRNLLFSLSRQEELMEDRLERVRMRLTEAIQAFVREGRSGDQANDALTVLRRKRKVLVESHDATEGEADLLKQRCAQLEELLSERRALLPSIQSLAQEQHAQRQESWMREIEQLRTSLRGAQREYQQLLQGVITLRGSLHRTCKGLENGGASQSSKIEELRLLESEVAILEQEQNVTVERQRSAASQLEQANVTLQSLMKAADMQVDGLKKAAGAESLLRAEVQIKEEQIQAEMQGRLVELHLHEGELHELNEELQRHSKKLSLLRMRYEEVMGSLARASQKQLSEDQKSDLSVALPPLDSTAANTNPEAVHAHLLLQRSFEREQLMQRGNYLDLRLVALDRETSTLRRMLDGLRAPSSTSTDLTPSTETACIESVRTNEANAHSTESTKRSGALVSGNTNSLAVVKEQLVGNELAREHYWRLELRLLDEAMTAMTHERERTRVQLNELRGTLKDLQGTEKQKRMRLQKLRDLVERSHKRAKTAAMKGIK